MSAWNLDVSSLMVLVGESEETKYRLMGRSIIECLSPAPVVGLQAYLQDYSGWVETSSSISYTSPYGAKTAPLRNMSLAATIEKCRLLKDAAIKVFHVRRGSDRRRFVACQIKRAIWVIMTWLAFGGILAYLFWSPNTTWIGIANILCISVWSIILRLIEHYLVRPRPSHSQVSEREDIDAVYILGRSDSCFVLEGTRQQIKDLTAQGRYLRAADRTASKSEKLVSWSLQSLSRLGSLLNLLFIFVTIPNGTTTDQVLFALLNLLGQANTLVGQWTNAICYLDQLDGPEEYQTDTRTAVWAFLLQKYNKGVRWDESVGLLPETDVWAEWRDRIVQEPEWNGTRAKQMYDVVLREKRGGGIISPYNSKSQ